MTMPTPPDLPPGHTIVSTPYRARRDGYWLATDRQGYEYVVGAYSQELADGSHRSVKTDCWGNERVWHRPKGGEWAPVGQQPQEPAQRRWYGDDE